MLPQIQQAGQYATQSVNRDFAAALGAVDRLGENGDDVSAHRKPV